MNKKIKLLYLMEFLYKESDELHPVSTPEIIDYLSHRGISAERKSIYEDLKLLQEWEMDILFTKSPKQGYYLASRTFELVDIKIIIDMLCSAEFISVKKTEELIQKCSTLLSQHDSNNLLQQLTFSPKKKENEHIFYTVDSLQKAITSHYSISFQYFDFYFKNEKKYRKNAQFYSLIPLALIFENQRYYCIGYSLKHHNLTHYRIDKMDEVHLQEYHPLDKKREVSHYIKTNFKLTLGEIENVSIQFDIALYSQVHDALGEDLFLEKKTDDYFIINLSTSLSPTFISWIFQFGASAKVLKPQKLIHILHQKCQDLIQLYSTYSKFSDEQ